jgi:hypothetical protein
MSMGQGPTLRQRLAGALAAIEGQQAPQVPYVPAADSFGQPGTAQYAYVETYDPAATTTMNNANSWGNPSQRLPDFTATRAEPVQVVGQVTLVNPNSGQIGRIGLAVTAKSNPNLPRQMIRALGAWHLPESGTGGGIVPATFAFEWMPLLIGQPITLELWYGAGDFVPMQVNGGPAVDPIGAGAGTGQFPDYPSWFGAAYPTS